MPTTTDTKKKASSAVKNSQATAKTAGSQKAPAAKTTQQKTKTVSKPAVKAPAKKPVAKPAAKSEVHIADKITALPRRRVWPD